MNAYELLAAGTVIPAHPLALSAERKLDERRQRALSRYYLDAGAGGLAVAVHTTQFAIRTHGLLEPVLTLAAEEARGREAILVAGAVGPTPQAVAEATLARGLGYHVALVSLGALRDAPVDALIDHLRAVGEVLPVMGFYLQPAVGGRVLPYPFWRRAAEIETLIAIKAAPFHRYQTIDVVRAVAESGRAGQIALYTGNDDAIVQDLLTTYDFGGARVRFVGGLLGQWAVGTHAAVELLGRCRAEGPTPELLTLGAQLTDLNAALFDVAHAFHGCIAGIHELLRRQGLFDGIWCLDPVEGLSPGQAGEITRTAAAYPHRTDEAFVRENLHRWLR
jgi:dihydrodipicolinate synthase/N-acetylneuraminate lyase